MRIYI